MASEAAKRIAGYSAQHHATLRAVFESSDAAFRQRSLLAIADGIDAELRAEREAKPVLPPPNRVPKNTSGMAVIPIESYDVASWGPEPDGKGQQTEVHFMLNLRGIEAPIAMRLKSRRAADELLAALKRHIDDVWPTAS
jgi:hypothetical protein